MHIEVFRNWKKEEWYWRFKNKGRITADAESFPSRANAIRAAKAVVTGIAKELNTTAPKFSAPEPVDKLQPHFLIRILPSE